MLYLFIFITVIFFQIHYIVGYELYYLCSILHRVGTAVEQWLSCCATNRKVTGSIPDGVIGIFH